MSHQQAAQTLIETHTANIASLQAYANGPAPNATKIQELTDECAESIQALNEYLEEMREAKNDLDARLEIYDDMSEASADELAELEDLTDTIELLEDNHDRLVENGEDQPPFI